MNDQTTTEHDEPTAPELPHILGARPELQTPPSIADRYDVLYAQQQGTVQHPRLMAAALALAWPRLRRKLAAGGRRYTGDVAGYGGEALEYLMGKGATFYELALWGQLALDVCATDLPGIELPATKADAEEVVGNSSDGEGSI